MRKIPAIILSLVMLITFIPCAGLTVSAEETKSGTLSTGLTWTIENGILTISGNGEIPKKAYTQFGTEGYSEVVIGEGVTKIWEYAFEYCSEFSAITFPTTLNDIYSYAFRGCTGIVDLYIPANVSFVSPEAFIRCGGLMSIEVEQGNPFCYSLGNCLIMIGDNWLIQGCNTSVIPEGITKINNLSFAGCSELTAISIPASVTDIDYNAFNDCSSVREITVNPDNSEYYASGNCLISKSENKLIRGCSNSVIPDTVTSIPAVSFYGADLQSFNVPSWIVNFDPRSLQSCKNLTELTVDPENPVYRSEGNCIIKKSDNTLIAGCIGSVIPDTVTAIGEDAFFDRNTLEKVIIPVGVKSIGLNAFEYCESLKGVSLPATLTSIEPYAFCNTKLETICYDGTADQWNSITKGNNAIPNTAAVYYGHDFQNVVTTPATCISQGVMTSICTRCGKADGTTPVAVMEHNMILQPGRESSETENGYREYYMCSDCGAFFEDAGGNTPIADIEEWKTDVNGGFIPMTGEEENVTIRDVIQAVINLITYFVSVIGRLINR